MIQEEKRINFIFYLSNIFSSNEKNWCSVFVQYGYCKSNRFSNLLEAVTEIKNIKNNDNITYPSGSGAELDDYLSGLLSPSLKIDETTRLNEYKNYLINQIKNNDIVLIRKNAVVLSGNNENEIKELCRHYASKKFIELQEEITDRQFTEYTTDFTTDLNIM